MATATLEQIAVSADEQAQRIAGLGVTLGAAFYDVERNLSPSFRMPNVWSPTRSEISHYGVFQPIIGEFVHQLKAEHKRNADHTSDYTYKLRKCFSHEHPSSQKASRPYDREIAKVAIILGREGTSLKESGYIMDKHAWKWALDRIVDKYAAVFQPSVKRLYDKLMDINPEGNVYGLERCITPDAAQAIRSSHDHYMGSKESEQEKPPVKLYLFGCRDLVPKHPVLN
ncbi:MAG: hypothetical protein V1703_01700 [Candidatus Altiarchaeota archaeon]